MRITLLHEPVGTEREGPPRLAAFAEAVGRRAGAELVMVAGGLDAAPGDGILLFAPAGDAAVALEACAPEVRARLAPRIVLLDASRQGLLDVLEEHGLAGAVDSMMLAEWATRSPEAQGAWGPFGFKALAPSIGATWMSNYQSARYGMLKSGAHDGVAHLLADYLRAYAANVPGGA